MCKVIKLPHSTYYSMKNAKKSRKKQEYEDFSRIVFNEFFNCKQIYGAVKLHRQLKNMGIKFSLGRVQRHLRRLELKSVVVKKYRPYNSKSSVAHENILNREFQADRINQKWWTDITYIYVQNYGWTYLASVMDLFTRKIIGYSYVTRCSGELAVKAIENACLNVKNTRGIIIHSDLGSQYTSVNFSNFINSKEMIHYLIT